MFSQPCTLSSGATRPAPFVARLISSMQPASSTSKSEARRFMQPRMTLMPSTLAIWFWFFSARGCAPQARAHGTACQTSRSTRAPVRSRRARARVALAAFRTGAAKDEEQPHQLGENGGLVDDEVLHDVGDHVRHIELFGRRKVGLDRVVLDERVHERQLGAVVLCGGRVVAALEAGLEACQQAAEVAIDVAGGELWLSRAAQRTTGARVSRGRPHQIP